MFISKHVLQIAKIKYCMNCFLLESLFFSGFNIIIVSRIFRNTLFPWESGGGLQLCSILLLQAEGLNICFRDFATVTSGKNISERRLSDFFVQLVSRYPQT